MSETRYALSCRDVGFGYGRSRVLDHVSFDLPPGELLGILGSNGTGKSTLLRLLAGYLRPDSGSVLIDGAAPAALPDDRRGRRVGLLPQQVTTTFPFLCLDMVQMGIRPPAGVSRLDKGGPGATAGPDQAMAALDALGAAPLAGRPFPQVSGGEQRLVLLAKMLAQDPDVLLLDEPTAALDLRHAHAALRLLAGRCAAGKTVACALHDLNLALAFCTRLLLLHAGTVAAFGSPAEVLATAAFDRAFQLRFHPLCDPATGRTLLVPEDSE